MIILSFFIFIVSIIIFLFLDRIFENIRIKKKITNGTLPIKKDKKSNLNQALEISKSTQNDCWFLDNQTWNDLQLNTLFEQIDISSSSLGSEFLFVQLHSIPKRDDNKFLEYIKFIEENLKYKIDIQCLFYGIGKQEYETVRSLPYQTTENKNYQLIFYSVLGLLPLVSMIISIGFPIFGGVSFLIFILINILFYTINRFIFDLKVSRLSYAVQTLSVARNLRKYNIPEIKTFCDNLNKFKFIKYISYIFNKRSGTYGASILFEYLNAVFMIPFISLTYVENKLSLYGVKFDNIIDALGKIEAAISITEYKNKLPHTCTPIFHDKVSIVAHDIIHPLTTNPVPNSLEINHNVIINGENASGKSTFIKTVAINCVLSQTVNIACAKSFHLKRGNIYSSLNIKDNLERGTSYFVEESLSLRNIIEKIDSDSFSYIFLDEAFKGTNTSERISITSSLIDWLSKKNCIYFITTHDIELFKLPNKSIEIYHFEGTSIADKIIYDYKLKKGETTQRNGIKILMNLGYPKEIIDYASLLFKDSYL